MRHRRTAALARTSSRWSRGRTAGLLASGSILLLAGITAAGCGGSASSDSAAPDPAVVTATASAQASPPEDPTMAATPTDPASEDSDSADGDHAAITLETGVAGRGLELNQYDLDGNLVDTVDVVSSDQWMSNGTFTATDNALTVDMGDDSMGTHSYNSDFSELAGIDAYDEGDAVPATLDVATGEVTDVVDPADHSGFKSTEPVVYVEVEFDPTGETLWGVRRDSDTKGTVVNLTTGQDVAPADLGDETRLYFSPGSSTPVWISPEVSTEPAGYNKAGNLRSRLEDESDLDIYPLRPDWAGTGQWVFTAGEAGDLSSSLWLDDGSANPTKLADLPATDPTTLIGGGNVIRFDTGTD